MSGLLQRLAARAIGTAPAVRPIVGWSAPILPSEPAPLVSEPQRVDSPDAAAAPRTHHAPDLHRPVGEPAAEERPATAPQPAHRSAPLAVDEVALDTTTLAPTTPGGPAIDAPRSLPPRTALAPQRRVEYGAPDEPDRSELPLPDRRAPFVPLLPPRTAPRTKLAQPESGVPARRPGAAAARTGASASAADDVTEVHVTIGRIELTAVQEAPRARPAPARTRKPQSLEEYLARRGTERR
jgi:hypothetical protein